ncbi:MAG TPA: hypothetical protein VMW89_03190 [Desulfatiglandales bacterium]|nr:hypothetical protein [Desulfatiglandales bacterium]
MERRVGFGAIPLDTLQFTAGSFITGGKLVDGSAAYLRLAELCDCRKLSTEKSKMLFAAGSGKQSLSGNA